MPRSPSTWSPPAGAGTRQWTGNCTSRVRGPLTLTAAGMPNSTRTPPSPPSRNWPLVWVARFLDAGHQAAWVAGDEVYGGNPRLRTALEQRGTGYVLAVACSHEVTTGGYRGDVNTLRRHLRR